MSNEFKMMSNEDFEILAAKAVKAEYAAMAKFEEDSEINSLFNAISRELSPLIKEEAS